ncbi:MAG: hypothetical protein H7Y37_06175 [Anaerolineae bacterium]|nr:hypothetical protein [Gloeobacterales cyanobacterium ES-bin-313]
MSRFPAQNEGETGIDASTVELAAFEDLSDEVLIGSAGTSPLHLIALHERYKRLVSELATHRPLSQRIWFNLFEMLEHDPQSLLPVEEKLTQMVEKLFGGCIRSEKTFLPDPLAWYLHRALNTLPQPMRVILQLVEVEQRSPTEITGFLAERGFGITVSEVEDGYAQAKDLLVEGLPAVVNRIYFGGVIDCLSLTPWLHLEIADEIRDFDVWKQTQTLPPQTAPTSADGKQRWWVAISVALSVLVIGVVASQPRQAIPTYSSKVSVQPPSTTPVPKRMDPPSAPIWSGKTYVLVADPGPEGFAKLQTIDRKIYYRKYQGKLHIQVGAFSTRSSAEVTGGQVSQLGFEPIFAPEIGP